MDYAVQHEYPQNLSHQPRRPLTPTAADRAPPVTPMRPQGRPRSLPRGYRQPELRPPCSGRSRATSAAAQPPTPIHRSPELPRHSHPPHAPPPAGSPRCPPPGHRQNRANEPLRQGGHHGVPGFTMPGERSIDEPCEYDNTPALKERNTLDPAHASDNPPTNPPPAPHPPVGISLTENRSTTHTKLG